MGVLTGSAGRSGRGDVMVWAKLATVATAFGQTTVRRDGTVPDRLTSAWLATEDRLPDGWVLFRRALRLVRWLGRSSIRRVAGRGLGAVR